MKFKELMNLKYCERTGTIPIDVLIENNINAPFDVLQQFYSDHGRKDDFQLQYGEIDLKKIAWRKQEVTGVEIITCEYYEEFGGWIDSVASRLDSWSEKEWNCIDVRKPVVAQWKNHKTWLTLPIFINPRLIRGTNGLHLVEGHTRLGVLKGLVKQKILSESSTHFLWYGE